MIAIVGVFCLAFISTRWRRPSALRKDANKAFKVAVYSYTPGGSRGALPILPSLGILGVLAALYGLDLLYLGLPALMNVRATKLSDTPLVVVCAIGLTIALGSIGAMIVAPAALRGWAPRRTVQGSAVRSPHSVGTARGNLRKMEESGPRWSRRKRAATVLRRRQPRSRGWELFSAEASAWTRSASTS